MSRRLLLSGTKLGGRSIVAVAILFGLIYWVVDTFLDYLFFGEGHRNLLDAFLLNLTPEELYNRLAFMAAFLVGGILVAGLLRRQRESESNYRALFETMTQGVIYQNEKGIFAMNRSAEEILGLSMRELAGKACSHSGLKNIHEDGTVFLPEEHPAIVALRQGKIVTNEVMGIFNERENRYRWISINAVPQFKDGGSTPYQVYSTFKDITDRILAEQSLRESERRYRNLYEKTPVMLHSINPEGRLVTVNEHWLETFGYTREEVIGRKWSDFLTWESADYAHKVGIPRFFATGRAFNYSYQVVKRNGELMDVLLSAIAERDEEGNIVRSITVIVDVTEQKRAETEILRLNEELERRVFERTAQLGAANKELEAFSYSVSHDLRAPLRSIDGFSRAVLEDYADKLDDRGQDYLRRVRGASQRMGQLIDDLLKLSRATRGEMRLEHTDLSALAGEVVELLRESDPQRQVEFVVQPGLTATVDPRLLRVALENLLDNAWKFTAKQEKAKIEFGRTEVADPGKLNGGVVTAFYIRDDGAGFDMTYAGKLFGAFQRLHGAKEFPGTGIGLATVQRIMHRHGGRVWAEGSVGKGATFYFAV